MASQGEIMQGGFGDEMRDRCAPCIHRTMFLHLMIYIPTLTQYKVMFFVAYAEKPSQTI
jgi:hypothetical protein